MLTNEERLQMLERPTGLSDAVLDTDTYNEIDDQYALSYLLRSRNQIQTKGILAAPFYNSLSRSPEDGMEKSYNEIVQLLSLLNREDLLPQVKKGSRSYLPDENTYVESEAARYLVELAGNYSPEHPLYVISIGAITNIASAFLMDETIKDRIVVVWLGGHGLTYKDTAEFNLVQDIAAARVVFRSGVPLVQFPCHTVVSGFRVSEAELDTYFAGANPLCDYLVKHTKEIAHLNSTQKAWSRVLWDVTAVSWLTGDFCMHRLQYTHLPGYDRKYEEVPENRLMQYVYEIRRDELFNDLLEKLTR